MAQNGLSLLLAATLPDTVHDPCSTRSTASVSCHFCAQSGWRACIFQVPVRILTYLCPSLPEEHRPSTTPRHRTLFWDVLAIPDQLVPWVRILILPHLSTFCFFFFVFFNFFLTFSLFCKLFCFVSFFCCSFAFAFSFLFVCFFICTFYVKIFPKLQMICF